MQEAEIAVDLVPGKNVRVRPGRIGSFQARSNLAGETVETYGQRGRSGR